jgi:uncharacterized protein YndB with AHSA1/START domain
MTTSVSASRVIEASPDDVFSTITDVARLPEWNEAITALIQRPERVEVGAQWVVEMHALGRTWHSRSIVETLDPIGRCFAYRSATDDGNPSFALWTWIVAGQPDGALVTVASELHPHTFWRRVLFVRIRSRQLARTELVSSLGALEAVAKHATSTSPAPTLEAIDDRQDQRRP